MKNTSFKNYLSFAFVALMIAGLSLGTISHAHAQDTGSDPTGMGYSGGNDGAGTSSGGMGNGNSSSSYTSGNSSGSGSISGSNNTAQNSNTNSSGSIGGSNQGGSVTGSNQGGSINGSNQGGSISGSNAGGNTSVFYIQNPLDQSKFNSVGGLLQGFLNIFVYLVVLFAVVMIIYIGFRFVMAQGNPAEIEERRNQLFWLIVGVAIVLGARIILAVVINTLSATGVVNQNVIQSAHNALNGQ